MKLKIIVFLLFASFTMQAQKDISIDSIVNFAWRTYISKPDSAQYYLHKGIQLAEINKDTYYKGLFLAKLITQKTRIKDYDSARYYFRKANAYVNNNKVKKLYGDVHSEIAETYYYMEKMDSALYHFKKASNLWAIEGDSIGVMISKNNIANVYQIQGNYKDAIINMLEAVKNVDTSQYKYIKVELYLNISELYKEIEDTDKSIEFAEKSLELALTNKDYPLDIVKAYVSLANHATNQNNFETSEEYLVKAEAVIEKEKLGSERILVFTSRSTLLIAQNNCKDAIVLIEEALQFAEKEKLTDFEIFSLQKNLAACYSKLDKPNRAIPLYNKILKTAIEDERLSDIATIYYGISEAFQKNGNHKTALENYKQFVRYNDSILGKDQQIAIKDAQVKYKTIEKEKLLAESRANLAETELKVKKKNYVIFGSLGLAILLGLLGYLFYKQQKLKNNQLKKENELKTALVKIETQNKLQEQRLRISRDLHDNIGSQLTFIISSIDNLKYKLKKGETVEKLSKISGFTTNTIYELRDTIWAMNKNDITFGDLQSRISNFIDQAKIASENTEFTFTISENINSEYKFTSIQGMNLYRIIQEGINNASKYAEATKISVSIKEENSKYSILIKDNGKGFNLATEPLGNGISNIKKRSKDLLGEVTFNSIIAEGTSILLLIPVS